MFEGLLELRIAKDTSFMVIGALISQFIGLILGVFIRRELSVAAIGQWALIQTFLGYSNYSGFILDGAFREAPMKRGMGDYDGASASISAALTFSLGVAILISLLAIPLAYKFGGIVLVFSGLNILQRLNNFSIENLYASKLFKKAGTLKVLSAIFNLVATFILVLLMGINGFYLAIALSFIFNIAYAGIPTRLNFDPMEISRLLKISYFIASVGFLHTLLMNIDRLFISRFIGIEALGRYTLATMASGFVLMLSNMFSAVLYPRILEAQGRGDGIAKYKLYPGLIIASISFLAAILMWTIAPWFTSTFIPQYTSGIPALRVMTISFIFIALISQRNHIVLALDRQGRMAVVYAIVIILAIPAYFLIGSLKLGIEYYAGIGLISFISIYLSQLWVTR